MFFKLTFRRRLRRSAGVLQPSSALRDRLGSVCERQASCRHARAESPSQTRV